MEKRGGRRGYLSVSAEEKAQVATYASTHSVRTAIKHFSKAFGKDLKEKTVRDPGHEIKKKQILGPFGESHENFAPRKFPAIRV